MPKTVLNEVDAPNHIARSRDWEKSISGRDTTKEKAALYNKQGHLIAARQGAEHATAFSDNELNAARGGTIIHNHPSGHSFSHEDLALAHVKGLTVRAVGTDKEGNIHTYQVKSKRPSQALGEKITREFPGEEKQAKESLLKIKPGLSDEQLFRMSREAAVARSCKENDLTYKHTYLKPQGVSDEMGNEQVKEYSEDQPRNDHGEWTSGGEGPIDYKTKKSGKDLIVKDKTGKPVAIYTPKSNLFIADEADGKNRAYVLFPNNSSVKSRFLQDGGKEEDFESWKNKNAISLDGKIVGYKPPSGEWKPKYLKMKEMVKENCKKLVAEFNPDQARDNHGRWISGDTGFGPLSKDSEHDIAKSVHTGLAARQGPALTQFAQHHADRYQSDPESINKAIQKGDRLSSEDSRTVDVMDHLTKESNIPHDLTMYKGVNSNVAKGFEGLQPGAKFRESGFVTGHLSSRDAKGDMGEGGGFVKVDVPAGNKGYAHLESDQTHVTLPKGQKYEYVGKSSVAVPGTGKMAPVYHVRVARFG